MNGPKFGARSSRSHVHFLDFPMYKPPAVVQPVHMIWLMLLGGFASVFAVMPHTCPGAYAWPRHGAAPCLTQRSPILSDWAGCLLSVLDRFLLASPHSSALSKMLHY